jgi:hypothetical protein
VAVLGKEHLTHKQVELVVQVVVLVVVLHQGRAMLAAQVLEQVQTIKAVAVVVLVLLGQVLAMAAQD